MFSRRIAQCAVLFLTTLIQGSQAGQDQQSIRENGNLAISLSKEYIEGQQTIMNRYFIKETEEIELRDIRLTQKIEKGRLTSLTSNIRVKEIDLKNASYALDFVPSVPPSESEACDTNFEVHFKFTKLAMVFEFD